MKEIELTPRAIEDLEAIWFYSYEQFGPATAEEYIEKTSAVFGVLTEHQIGTHRPELGNDMHSLPVEKHVIFFVPSQTVITVIRILSQAQEVLRHSPWR